MFKVSAVLLGTMVALPIATDVAQASGGCGPHRYRGVFNQCWLTPPTFRPVVRVISKKYLPGLVYRRFYPYVRSLPIFHGGERHFRYANGYQNQNFSRYAYNQHYSYHYNRRNDLSYRNPVISPRRPIERLRYSIGFRNYQFNHYSYHYSYHYIRNNNFHYRQRIIAPHRFVNQTHNLINERRFLNRTIHRNFHRYF